MRKSDGFIMETVATTELPENIPTNADLAHIDDLHTQMQADDAAIAEFRAESAAC